MAVHALPFGGLQSGGIMGYDNMHPTWAGYSEIAKEVLNAIHVTENLDVNYNLIEPQVLVNEIEDNKWASALRIGPTEDSNLSLAHAVLLIMQGTAAPVQTPQTKASNNSLRNVLNVLVGPLAPRHP